MNHADRAFDVKAYLCTLTRRPGVYKMLNAAGDVIYIGKAKNLKNRVSSHFRARDIAPKQQAMLAHVAAIEVTVTHTEGEALLLENQLIKRYKPRYNICLRDDKSYPYIYVTTQQRFPRVTFHRGARRKEGRYFGPYPSAGAVRETLKLLQKVFPVRQCEDATFNNRSRPCLQYQIKRCTAPCVDFIGEAEYGYDVDFTLMFLEGRGDLVIDEMVKRMESAARDLDFEKAARFRDQIATLRTVLEKQCVAQERGDLDIIACASKAGAACVQVVFIRRGQYLGDKTFYPKMSGEHDPKSVLAAFIPQYYLGGQLTPGEILVSHEVKHADLLAAVLADQAKHPVAITSRVRGDRLRWLKMAQANAENALVGMLSNREGLYARFLNLQQALSLGALPRRLECFDISHTQGEQTVASCVVFDREGPVKSAYRRFNIEGITPGDDYAAMAQAITRRYRRLKKGEHERPDILFIDGGKGQVGAAEKVLKDLEVKDVMIIGVAKGPARKAGMETLVLAGEDRTVAVDPGSSALLLIQHIRDEAHRFAITGHRQRRGRAKKASVLESIEGLGPKRRQTLLKQFGGLQGVTKAGVDALCSVEGISQQLAQRIYDTFHQQDN